MNENIKYYYELFETFVKDNNRDLISYRVANALRTNKISQKPPFDMEVITGIILKKYSVSGLQYILDNAWKIVEENEKKEVMK